SSSPRWSGSRGTPRAACSSRSAPFRRTSSSGPTTTARRPPPSWPYSHNRVFGEPGAVHVIVYTGQGGNDPNTGKQIAHQQLALGNAGLMRAEPPITRSVSTTASLSAVSGVTRPTRRTVTRPTASSRKRRSPLSAVDATSRCEALLLGGSGEDA